MIAWDRVSELRNEIGESDFQEIVTIFLEEVDEVIDRFRAAPETLPEASDLHYLKGSALNLGFRGLATLCEQGEAAARAGIRHDVSVARIVESYETSRTVFLGGLTEASRQAG